MKTIFIALLLTISTAIVAQKNKAAKWASDKGFWIIESTKHTPKNCTVYFYNTEKQLVYKEKIEGKTLNPQKKKIKMKLKRILEQTVAHFEQHRHLAENETLLAGSL